ncbi:hypothetical protein ig2599ANME_1398 [groundwater metagenome]
MSPKIIICFIILFFISPAYASTTDNVWVAKHSGFITSDEPLSFENYIIKSRILDSTSATITIYKNQNQVDASDFNVNQFKSYDDVGVTLLGIKGVYSWIAISKLENRAVWRPIDRKLLNWGGRYQIDNYTISIETIGTQSVNLRISSSTMSETSAISKGGFKDYGNLRLSVKEINRTGIVELEFFTNKPPAIKAEISTDKGEYFPDDVANVKVAVEDVVNVVGVTLESSHLVEFIPDRYTATGTGARVFYSQITGLPANSTMTITAKIEQRDFYNHPYAATVCTDVLITPEVSIRKIVPQDTDDENVAVELHVYNSGLFNRSIRVHDTIPEELVKKEMDWNIELGPKKSTTLRYSVTPQGPGLYLLPPAIAQWDGQSSISKRMRMTMHMPYITLEKTAIINGSVTDVNIVISNKGDRRAEVKMKDSIPEGASLISGSTQWQDFLGAGKSATVEYSLQGTFETLPAAGATYRDVRGTVRQANSNIIEPIINKEMPLSSEQELLSFMAVSFAAIAGIISAAALFIYLVTRLRKG